MKYTVVDGLTCGEYYSAVMENGVLARASTWVGPENVTLHEGSQM